MATVKTAISLQKDLFDQVEELSRQMKVSRSRVFALALERFIRDRQDRDLFDQINLACDQAPPDQAERSRMSLIQRQHRLIVEGEW